MMMIEVMLAASPQRARAGWLKTEDGAALAHWLTVDELQALAPRRNRAEAAMARMLAKTAVRLVLRRAGLRPLPAARELRIAVEPGGRPWVDLPAHCAERLARAALGLDISLSHAHDRALAVVVLA